ncbi:MAG: xanthine dehydrogenase family protein subunit M [Deltaproteobacteria bacterium]|nr:xanthine dehydrogenase family protein subunit M [Deltaproteobacteria bacterium]
MLLPKFEFHEPETLKEAAAILSGIGEPTSILAGGTDLLVNMKKGKASPRHLVSLGRVRELKKTARDGESLRIGACVTVAELREEREIKDDFDGLFRGAGLLGSPLIRNLATVGGNIVTARPAADLPPPLIAYGATIELVKDNGERILSLEDFIKGPGETSIEPGEILSGIILREPPLYSGGGYVKLGMRKALEISLVNVATFFALDGPSGPIQKARVVLGSVGPTPIRSLRAEEILTGERPDEALFEKAGEAAANDAKPIDDFRASAEYRSEMVKLLTRKALKQAYEEAKLREWRRWK